MQRAGTHTFLSLFQNANNNNIQSNWKYKTTTNNNKNKKDSSFCCIFPSSAWRMFWIIQVFVCQMIIFMIYIVLAKTSSINLTSTRTLVQNVIFFLNFDAVFSVSFSKNMWASTFWRLFWYLTSTCTCTAYWYHQICIIFI